jgi:hypothetical protein
MQKGRMHPFHRLNCSSSGAQCACMVPMVHRGGVHVPGAAACRAEHRVQSKGFCPFLQSRHSSFGTRPSHAQTSHTAAGGP